ncbi:MAG: hypothetical protein J6W65_04555 [Oscillospiraceae bacterium]|nr:hypothetical protein [Oscillospiraceae bacterium]
MISFLRKEPVLSAAAAGAVLSAFFVHPSADYLGYINFSVLILLFCLMMVVAGLMETKLFDVISAAILKSSDSSRTVANNVGVSAALCVLALSLDKRNNLTL